MNDLPFAVSSNRSLYGCIRRTTFRPKVTEWVALCVLSCAFFWTPMDLRAQEKAQAGEKPAAYASNSSHQSLPYEREALDLSLKDYLDRVLQKNERIAMSNSQYLISLEAITNAKSIFEPAFVSSLDYGYDKHRNTVQEALSQDNAELFWEHGTDSQAGIEGLLPTGGRMRLGSSMRAVDNSLQEQQEVDPEREYESFLGVNLTQPLLKNAGIQATTTGIRVAEKEADIAFQTYRRDTMRVLTEASAAYWDLYLAQEQYLIRKESEQNARNLLDVNLARVKTGKMAETEALEASSALAFRQALVTEAQQAITSSMNAVRNLLSNSAAQSSPVLRATDTAAPRATTVDLEASLNKALQQRPEYLSSRKRIEREEIKLVFAKNQRWPQLDLVGSYGHNGLADSFGKSYDEIFDESFRKWAIGVEMRIPLGGGSKSRSELAAAKQRKRQALLELKAVETAVANEVDTAIHNVTATQEQIGHFSRAVDMNQRLLEAEIAKFQRGKSNSRILLEREEDLLAAKEASTKSLVKLQKALLQLELAEGSILIKNDAEPEEMQ